jgi:hypothetical protein
MSTDVDSTDNHPLAEDGLIYPKLVPFVPSELSATNTRDGDLDGLTEPESIVFNREAHFARLEQQITRWCLLLLGMLMVLTFGLAAFGDNSAADRAVEIGALFIAPISGALGYALGRLQRAGNASV